MVAANLISTDRNRAVVGLGVTGKSVAGYLKKTGKPFSAFDSRTAPPGIDGFYREHPDVEVRLGPFDLNAFDGFDEVILSPGIASNKGVFKQLRENGVRVVGDIEIFAENANAPIIAITGSNAKSTVTTLVGEMAKAGGLAVCVGGNLGVPVLDLLKDNVQLYVLELSSFQLETTNSLKADVACILNISQDHLDRYDSMLDYHQAKQRIYRGAKHVVCNRADALTTPLLEEGQSFSTFGLGAPDLKQFGLIERHGEPWISCGVEPLIKVSDVTIAGRHNIENAISAVTIGSAAQISVAAMHEALERFAGLPHRCEIVAEFADIRWINDSKATNAGAVIAALEGLSEQRNIVLIAGGQAKGQEFTSLAKCITQHAKCAILMGEAAKQIAASIELAEAGEATKSSNQPKCTLLFAMSMEAAVETAAQMAVTGDIVLMSPACASFDMFDSYEARGDAFAQAVRSLQ